MPCITKITPQKKSRERFNVYLDGKYGFAVSMEVLSYFGLSGGDVLDEEKIDSIITAENKEKVFNKVLNFISYKPRTEYEVRSRLDKYLKNLNVSRKLKQELRNEVLKKISDLDLIDDEKFVRDYFENCRLSKTPRGVFKIRDFLFKKGVSRDLIDRHMETYSREIERKGVLVLTEKKMKGLDSSSYKDKQRIFKYLIGKGYSIDVVKAVVDSNFKV